jgi:hypothetical protein
MKKQKPKPMSLRAYAERRGVSTVAVSKAITAGRLRDSVVTIDGQPKISDAELADREWQANTRMRVEQPPPHQHERPAVDEPAVTPTDVPDYNVSRALREAAAARREAAQADLAEIEVAQRRGELVLVDQARADVIDKFTTVKTRLLGVPSRIAQRFPRFALELVPVLDDLLREALEELAIDGDATKAGSDDNNPETDDDNE